MKDPAVHDGFKKLLQTQDLPPLPDFLELGIMAKIEAVSQKKRINISLQSVFVLSLLASTYILISVFSVYYPPYHHIFQDIKTITSTVFLVKICYDLNEIMPGIIQYLTPSKKVIHP